MSQVSEILTVRKAAWQTKAGGYIGSVAAWVLSAGRRKELDELRMKSSVLLVCTFVLVVSASGGWAGNIVVQDGFTTCNSATLGPAGKARGDYVKPEDPVTPMTIDEAKKAPDGVTVLLENVTVAATLWGDDPVTPRDPDAPKVRVAAGVQEMNRCIGIRVLTDANACCGGAWTVHGVTATVDGERVIDARDGSLAQTSAEPTAPGPMGMSNKSSGGAEYGMQGAVVDDAASGRMAVGLNNVGHYVKIVGKVTAVFETGFYDGYFYVDDGSGLDDGSGSTGVRCRAWPMYWSASHLPDILPFLGDYVAVTGVMGVTQITGVNARFLWATSVIYSFQW